MTQSTGGTTTEMVTQMGAEYIAQVLEISEDEAATIFEKAKAKLEA